MPALRSRSMSTFCRHTVRRGGQGGGAAVGIPSAKSVNQVVFAHVGAHPITQRRETKAFRSATADGRLAAAGHSVRVA